MHVVLDIIKADTLGYYSVSNWICYQLTPIPADLGPDRRRWQLSSFSRDPRQYDTQCQSDLSRPLRQCLCIRNIGIPATHVCRQQSLS